MMIKALVNDCDFTGRKYPAPVWGAHCFARGATGRVCLVMTMGPEYVAEHDPKLSSDEELEAWANDAPGGYLDY